MFVSNSQQCYDLLSEERFSWVKEDLFPIFGMLDIRVEKPRTEFESFCFPLSRENIILNLNRVSKKQFSSTEKEFTEFEKEFAPFFEVYDKICTYDTGISRCTHPPRSRPCPNPEDATRCYILGEDLEKAVKGTVDSLSTNIEGISPVIAPPKIIEDLIYILLLKRTAQDCIGMGYSWFEDNVERYLKNSMKRAEIDDEIIDKMIGWQSDLFKVSFESMCKYLPENQLSFVIYYGHIFNTSSCSRQHYISLLRSVADQINNAIDEEEVVQQIKDAYNKVKQATESKPGRKPPFSYSPRFDFLNTFARKSSRGEKFYSFEIEGTKFEDVVKSLTGEGTLSIVGNEIRLVSEDEFESQRKSLESREQGRVAENVQEITVKWLRTEIELENDTVPPVTAPPVTVTPEPKPPAATPPMVKPQDFPPKENAKKIRVLLGKSGDNQSVYWEPGSEDNGYMIILGSAGSGKTQTIKALASSLINCGYPVLLVDFHGDMVFEHPKMRKYTFGERTGNYFNPFELNPTISEVTPIRATSDFIDALAINYPNLGIKQKQKLRKLLKELFISAKMTDDPETWKDAVNVKDIEPLLEDDEDLSHYFAEILDYKLFTGTTKVSTTDVLEPCATHLNLKPLPENMRGIFADLFLRKLFYTLQALGHIQDHPQEDSERFRIFVIVDEAKLLVSSKGAVKAVLNKYSTEIRKYGGGLIMASQIIDHFNDEILANIPVKVCMKASNKKAAKKHGNYFDVDEKALQGFSPGDCFLVTDDIKKEVHIIPLNER